MWTGQGEGENESLSAIYHEAMLNVMSHDNSRKQEKMTRPRVETTPSKSKQIHYRQTIDSKQISIQASLCTELTSNVSQH